ncbi:ATP/GTP-binding protein [Arcicella rosea]|uniref:AAA15 family ATPase/GTPase n=1 Tax=Arcicella rosea TaxID=502909 RepID=A0A841EEW7_9BACT|nr:AAA family ATPase [Arcicella rosea]MBB6001802.1 AAA15 family ATPase/GTPase [Arcicella rosea]
MIQKIHIKNFTRFEDNSFEFSKGLNVFVGQNGSGKTHLLKLLLVILKTNEANNGSGKEKFESLLGENLVNYFKPENLGRLVKRSQGRAKAEINIEIDGIIQSFNFSTNSKTSVKTDKYSTLPQTASLYIPPREIISVFEGFISLYQKREISFDETYYQLALALDTSLLKGRRFDEAQKLVNPLEKITGANVLKENGRFYFKNEQGKMEMPLVAEGFRKIATLMYLILNGELGKNSVLFWDEPEANLNPRLISQIAEILITLANNGVQVFIASHDYLLTNLLSLKSEYRKDLIEETLPPIKFFGMYEKENELLVDEGESIADLSENSILEEFSNFYDLEQTYFNKALKS